MKYLHIAAFILLVIGGLNWLLVGLFAWNVFHIFGETVSRFLPILIGLSAIVEIATHKKDCRNCSSSV